MRKRNSSSSGIYHVIMRGVNRCQIFKDETDYRVFIKYLIECREQSHFLIYCYCLMGNHVHLLFGDREGNLSKSIQNINEKYALYFNSKYERVGHLFQSRFKSKPVEDRVYFYSLMRYIILNPTKAFGIPAAEYPWSSYRDYVYGSPATDTQAVWSELGGHSGFIKLIESNSDSIPQDCEIGDDVPDNEVIALVYKLGGVGIGELNTLSKDKRASILLGLKDAGIPVPQVSRLTGISRSTIYRV